MASGTTYLPISPRHFRKALPGSMMFVKVSILPSIYVFQQPVLDFAVEISYINDYPSIFYT